MILKNGLAGALALAIGWSTANAAPVLYGVDDFNDSLVTIDPATGVVTQVGDFVNLLSFDAYGDLAFGEDGTLFVSNGNRFGSEADLLTVDPATGAILTRLRSAPTLGGLTVSNGTLYGLAGGSFDDLVSIDPATGSSTTEVSLGAPIVGGFIGVSSIATAPDGTIFGVDAPTGSLLTIDPVTGATVIGTNTVFGGVEGLAFDPSGRLFANTDDLREALLLELDPLTGAILSQVALTEGKINGIAFFDFAGDGGDPVPLPAAAWLFGSIAAAGLSLRKRRPKA